MLEPGLVTYSPAAHSVHAAQKDAPDDDHVPGAHAPHEAAFDVALKVPAAHVPHTRFAVLEPALVTYWPGAHTVHAAHDVEPAGAQLPAAHDVHAVRPVPSAEYVPAGHALHV